MADEKLEKSKTFGKIQLLEHQQPPDKEVPKNDKFPKSPENLKIPEKREIVEVSETDYRNNETCIVGDLSEEEEDEKPIIPEAANITPFPSSIINLVSLPANQAPLSIAPIPEENEVCETTSEESAERLAGLINENTFLNGRELIKSDDYGG